MGKILYPLISFLLLMGCGVSYAAQHDHAFMPDNTLSRYDNINQTNIAEVEFNSILDKVENIYKPIFKQFGATFVLERAWDDSTVNAYADQQGNNWIVHMYGGMARRQEMNVAGFALVACHEIGHHLGGFPFYSDSSWAANEGQSDYFANFVCAKKVLGGLPLDSINANARAKCDSAWPNQEQRDLCYLGISGGQALGNLLGVLGGTGKPNYDTPDLSVVTKTSDEHPRAQCRLDTYLAASICTAKVWNDGVIPRQDGAVCENRPKCWFAPAGSDPQPPPSPGGSKELSDAFNYARKRMGASVLTVNPKLECAAARHAQDVGNTGVCSHVGSDRSTYTQRMKGCGMGAYGAEVMACRYPTAQDAVNAWVKDWRNRQVLQIGYWRSVGCAQSQGMYVCLVATQ